MPLLYGQEEKAFRPLQEEIVRTTPDLSIFAWRLPLATKIRKHAIRACFPVFWPNYSSLLENADHSSSNQVVHDVNCPFRIAELNSGSDIHTSCEEEDSWALHATTGLPLEPKRVPRR